MTGDILPCGLPVAQLMATLVVQDGPAEVMARLNQAARQAAEEKVLVQAILFATGVQQQVKVKVF